MQKIDRCGLRYGKLTVLRESKKTSPIEWVCRCECGNELTARGSNLASGNTSSCGCVRRITERTSPLPAGLLFDNCDAAIVDSRNWYINDQGYVLSTSVGRERLHRLILSPRKGYEIDHINGDKLDNRRANLRVVKHIENTRNLQGSRSNNRSGYRGVFWDTARCVWVAQAKVDGKNHYLGRHETAEEAAATAKAWRLSNMPGALS